MKRKVGKKKPNLNSKAGKFFIARAQGHNKAEAAAIVGIDPRNVAQLERTQNYQAIEKKYSISEAILKQISLDEIAIELVKNILQDEDRGAKNKAIEIASNKLEPAGVTPNTDADRVFVVIAES